jgi:hypothetical protein
MNKKTVKECGRYNSRNFIEKLLYTETFSCNDGSEECIHFWRNFNKYQVPVHLYIDAETTNTAIAIFTVPFWWFERAGVVRDYANLELNFIKLSKMAMEKGIVW